MKVLLIIGKVQHYREKLYKIISKSVEQFDILQFEKERQIRGFNGEIKYGKKIDIFNIKYIKDLKEQIKKYDIIIVLYDIHWINTFYLPITTNKPIVYWGHGLSKNAIVNKLKIFLSKYSKSIITYNEIGKTELANRGVHSDKIYIADNTIYVSNSDNYSNSKKDSILYVGRLQYRKGLDVLLKSFALSDLPMETRLRIVGEGDVIKCELKSLARELEIVDRVDFLEGTLDNKILSNEFKRAYSYVSPNHVGLGVLHSFAYGVPVITFRSRDHAPEITNIKNDINSFLVEGGIEEMAKKISKVVNEKLYINAGNEAYKHFCENRNIYTMANQIIKTFK